MNKLKISIAALLLVCTALVLVPAFAQENALYKYLFASAVPPAPVTGVEQIKGISTSLQELRSKKREIFLIQSPDPNLRLIQVEQLSDSSAGNYLGVNLQYDVAGKGYLNVIYEPFITDNATIVIEPSKIIKKLEINGNPAVLYDSSDSSKPSSDVSREQNAVLSMIYRKHQFTFAGSVGSDQLIEMARLVELTP